MLCKKCGVEIQDNSKFCGYCGNKIEPIEVNNQPSIENINTNNVVETNNNFNNQINNNLDETTKIEIVQPSNEMPIMNNQPVMSQQSVISEQPVMNQQPVINNEVPMNNSQNNASNNKNNNKLIFIISGLVLAIIAVIVVAIAFNKSSNSSIAVLKKSLANLEQKSSGSLTMDAKLTMESTTGESFSFSATMKVETKNENKGKIQLTVNKSMFFDEINAYAVVDENQVTLYAKSDLIDMLGYTYSETPMWLYYKEMITELDEETVDETVDEIDLADIIDEEHFIFIDEVDGIKHYQLVIDQKLVDNMKVELKDEADESIKDTLDSIETIETPVKLDFYINKSNELTKIALDLVPYMEEESEFKKFEISFEFSGLNSTKVEIPSEAEKSTMDFETYTTTYSSYSFDYDYDYDYDDSYGTDFGFDSEYDFDGMNDELDYDATLDTGLNNTVYGF